MLQETATEDVAGAEEDVADVEGAEEDVLRPAAPGGRAPAERLVSNVTISTDATNVGVPAKSGGYK